MPSGAGSAPDGLSEDERRNLEESALYIRDRGLLGMDVPAPKSWTPEQVAAFEHVIASQSGRDALLACAIRGWQRNVLAAHASAPL